MNVQVRNRLSGRRPVVDADVEGVGMEFLVDAGAGTVEQRQDRQVFIRRQVKERSDVATGDEQEKRRLLFGAIAGKYICINAVTFLKLLSSQ